MKYFDSTLPTPAENLACDEALLDLREEGRVGDVLRFWEPREPFVVVGYANRVEREVNLEACRARGIPVLRRCSGGGTVVQGAGCLDYSLILGIGDQGLDGAHPGAAHDSSSAFTRIGRSGPPGPLEGGTTNSIGSTNTHVLSRHRTALAKLLKAPVEIQGHTDLAVNDLKFSGNAQRRLRHALIFHGTFLLDFDLGMIEELLPLPSQQPEYRRGRSHGEFVRNLNAPAAAVKAALREAWGADEVLKDFPGEKMRELVAGKYATEGWNLRF
jgi:lipoate-protein ligase A